MISVSVKENEPIEKALKRFKQKFDRAGVIKELRCKTYFLKPSIGRREEILKAAYRQKRYGEEKY